MPTYDYLCEACGHELEIFQGIKDDPVKKCPECKKNKLKRQFGTGAAIVFKGSGFYQTDYRSDSYKKGAQADKKAGESKSESKGDSSSKKDSAKSDSGKSESSSSKPTKKSSGDGKS